MNEVGVEIVKTEETEESGIKYLNINVSNSEVERKPDIVRLCADAGILEYVKPSGDAISRQAVFDALYELCDTGETLIENPWRDNPHIDVLVDAIEELPPVNPQEPKTGHWIMPVQDDGMSDPIYYQVRCSECGFDLDPQTWHQELHQYGADKFCPKCGCAMKRE